LSESSEYVTLRGVPWLARCALAPVVDLVLPVRCAGCDRPAVGDLCDHCRSFLAGLSPATVRPDPAPPGTPPCMAGAEYAGPLRALIVAYKERGRHRLATVLGELLARVILAAEPAAERMVLVPVPATATAARRRYGDHISRLAYRAARVIRRRGRQVTVVSALAARRRPDSVGMTAVERVRTAQEGFKVRSWGMRGWCGRAIRRSQALILVDDVMTTGATLSATAEALRARGAEVTAAAVLAATRRIRRRSVDPVSPG